MSSLVMGLSCQNVPSTGKSSNSSSSSSAAAGFCSAAAGCSCFASAAAGALSDLDAAEEAIFFFFSGFRAFAREKLIYVCVIVNMVV